MSLTKTLSAFIVLSFAFSPLQAKERPKTTTSDKTTTQQSKKGTSTKKTPAKKTPAKKDSPKATNSKKTPSPKGITVADPKTAAAIKKSASSLSSAQRKSMLSTLNKGASSDLIKIPGLGEKTIALIKKARPYKDVTDLGNVTGIGQKKFSDIVKYFKSKK